MKHSIKTLILSIVILTISCNRDEDALISETTEINEISEEMVDCEFRDDHSGICLCGPMVVIPGETYIYKFTLEKRNHGANINEVVNWIVKSGEIEVKSIKTTLLKDYTLSIATIAYKNNFDTGVIRVSSDKLNVDSPTSSPYLSFITYPITTQ